MSTAPWRALLVDDERLAGKRLTTLLAAHPELQVAGEARDLATARALLAELKPEVVFLDVHLPPENGFDLLPAIPATTEVIFVTAHDGFAVRAFEANALDYLLKPVLPTRLARSVDRLLRRRQSSSPFPSSASNSPIPTAPALPRLGPGDPLLLRDGRQWHKLEIAAVAAICGEGTYTRLYTTAGGSLLQLRTLAQWTALLPEEQFVRVSRSILVNLQQVERLETINRDQANLHLRGQPQPLELGRVASQELRTALRKTIGANG
ncbi:MAG: response regulator transcription factor [Verrucomicrobia bacterium]|nr:response regulator transcription factor [Verrucomicrobiota bacterium]